MRHNQGFSEFLNPLPCGTKPKRFPYTLSIITDMIYAITLQVSCPKITGIAKKKLLHNFQRTSRPLSFKVCVLPSSTTSRSAPSFFHQSAASYSNWFLLDFVSLFQQPIKRDVVRKLVKHWFGDFSGWTDHPLVVERHLQMPLLERWYFIHLANNSIKMLHFKIFKISLCPAGLIGFRGRVADMLNVHLWCSNTCGSLLLSFLPAAQDKSQARQGRSCATV